MYHAAMYSGDFHIFLFSRQDVHIVPLKGPLSLAMLSLLSKAVGYLTGDAEEDEEPPPRAPRQPPWLLNDSAEKTKEQTRFEF